jgi:hypothetical protein
LLARRFGIRRRQEYDEFNRLAYHSATRKSVQPNADVDMTSDDDGVVELSPEKKKPKLYVL